MRALFRVNGVYRVTNGNEAAVKKFKLSHDVGESTLKSLKLGQCHC